MGCIESIENKFQEMDERFRQVFEADKYFVENMQMVATCHAFRQENILCDFQFMETNKITRELLRKFMLQLRSIDFVLVGRIMLEYCLKAKNGKGELLDTCANYLLSQSDILTKEQRITFRIQSLAQCKTDEDKLNFELQMRQKMVMEKLCEGYNYLSEQRDQKQKQLKLNELLKNKMNEINQIINQYRQLEQSKQDVKWTDKLAAELENVFKTQLSQMYIDSGVNGGSIPKELTLIKFKETMQKLDRGEEVQEQQCYKLDSYLRKLVLQVKNDCLSHPDVDLEKHETKQFRYLYLNKHAYYNYAKYLQDIQEDLIKKWEAEYTKWVDQNKPQTENDTKLRKLNQEAMENKRIEQAKIDAKLQQAKFNKEQEEKKAKEEEDLKISKMTEAEKTEYNKQKEIEKQANLKKRVDAPKNIDEEIQKDLEKYLNWVKKSGQVPKLQDVINNPNFFLDDATKYWNKGLKMVAKGRVALVLLAGDSDLKWNYKEDAVETGQFTDEKTPFGFRPTGLNSQKCLFQLFCEKVEAVQRLAHMYRPDRTLFMENSRVHIYVMTNSENDYRTRKLFRKHLNFGLWKKNIHFFEQGNLPMIGQNGQIRLRDKLRLMNLPDGTGGFYDAVHNNELLKEWDFWGIKYLHVMGIDNLLGRPVDPTLLGMLRGVDGVENGLEVVTKAVQALDENEHLSRIVMQNRNPEQKPQVLQPSVLRLQDAQVAKDCQLAVYNDFACTTNFVRKAIENRNQWEAFHVSTKTYDFHNLDSSNGQPQKLQDPSYIFEKDILDPLVIIQPRLFGVLQVDRRNEYAPVKKLNRTDSIAPQSFQSAIVQMALLNFRWLIDHGYQFENMEFYTNDDLHKLENVDEIQNKLSALKLETQIFSSEEFKQFIGEKTREEWEKEKAEKDAAKEKKREKIEKARKKQAKIKNISIENVPKEETSDDDEEDVEESITLFKNLVEIDARQSLHGENIPQPKSYVALTAETNTKKDSLPFYLKSNARPIKWKLPWMLNEIYRYI